MKYKIKGACKSVIGSVRENNEDNYYFNFKTLKEENTGNSKINVMEFQNDDNIVLAVFDGMGGESNGERASFLAANTLHNYLSSNVDNTFSWANYIKTANEKICDEIHNNIRMGTTLASIRFTANFIDICNLGDSKIYGLKGKVFKQLSYDHTDENLQKKLHVNDKKTYKLTQHLGIKEEEMKLTPYIKKINYSDYDKILLCSDGLTDMLTNSEITKILSLDTNVKIIVDKLVNAAINNGGKDNITVIVLEIKKKLKQNYKKYILPIGISAVAFTLIILIIRMNTFKIITDNYTNAINVGESYEFKYRGNYKVNISNENIKYEDGKIIAIHEGISTITITNKKGSALYSKTIKIFPK